MASEGYQDMTKTSRTDEHKGRQYRCDDCGRTYWTAWGNARRHTCDGEEASDGPEVRTDGGEKSTVGTCQIVGCDKPADHIVKIELSNPNAPEYAYLWVCSEYADSSDNGGVQG